MKFIVNTAIDPHFCALFDEQDQLIAEKTWDENRKDGQAIFDFCAEHDLAKAELTFLGGVTGPGSFASLRVTSNVLKSLGFVKQLPFHTVRADVWVTEWLGEDVPFLLNSFSNWIWEVRNGGLERIDTEEAANKFPETPVYVGFLPEKKREFFAAALPAPETSLAVSLLEILKKAVPVQNFVPAYEVPPV